MLWEPYLNVLILLGKITGLSPRFHGKFYGFQLRFSREKQSIENPIVMGIWIPMKISPDDHPLKKLRGTLPRFDHGTFMTSSHLLMLYPQWMIKSYSKFSI